MTGEPDTLDLREQYHIIAWVFFLAYKECIDSCLITFVKPFPIVLFFCCFLVHSVRSGLYLLADGNKVCPIKACYVHHKL